MTSSWTNYTQLYVDVITCPGPILSAVLVSLPEVTDDVGNLSPAKEYHAPQIERIYQHMMTSYHGNIFCFTGHLSGEFTGHRSISRTKASDAELVIWDAIAPIMTSM